LKDFVQMKKADKAKDQIPWGTLFARPSEDQNICFLAWKDNALVLFQSTISDGQSTIVRERKRPSETSSSAKTARVPFGDSPTKELSIPRFVDDYNRQMNAVDQADQLRSYNSGLRRIRKGGWHAIWHFIFNVVLVNCYLLSFYFEAPNTQRFTTQQAFRIELSTALMKKAQQTPRKRKAHISPNIDSNHKLEPTNSARDCHACKARGNVRAPSKRRILGDITGDSSQNKRPPASRYACIACQAPLCFIGDCFEWYHENLV
jgi:hypothetical protein